MNWKVSSYVIVLFCMLVSCIQNQENKEEKDSQYLIQAEELLDYINSPKVKVIDFRKNEQYTKEHISGAINIWRTDIENLRYPYKGMMANKAKIENVFSTLGINNGDTLVVYDDRGSCDAARLWWVLQNHDYTSLKILDGGLQAWNDAGGTTTNKVEEYPPSEFKLPEQNFRLIAKKEEVLMGVNGNDDVVIIDTRSIDEYTGKRQKKGASKAGRIPNSKLIDWTEAIDYSGSKKLRSIEELKVIYSKLKVPKDHPIIVYCHTGVRSSHTTFVLKEILGYTNVKNYDGSWSEWSYYDRYPTEKDSTTTIP